MCAEATNDMICTTEVKNYEVDHGKSNTIHTFNACIDDYKEERYIEDT